MWGIFIVIFVLLFVILVTIAMHRQESERRAKLRNQIAQYQPEELYWSDDYRSAFGISRKRQTIVLYSKEYFGEYEFARIASAEILRDGVTITNSNRASQLAGAAVGGLVFGGIGALAGALTGSSRSVGNIKSLELKVIVDCASSPIYVIKFFNTVQKSGGSSKDVLLKKAVEKLDRCHAMLVNAMRNHQAALTQSAHTHFAQSQPALSSPAQLQQLWELRQAGALTEAEFLREKQKLIG